MQAILIAGTNSGSGKTTITLGLIRALTRRALQVQPFKVGPDYIDTAWHTQVANVPSHNLDPFMLDDNRLYELFVRQTQQTDIAVIEGVMGLYDGYGADPYYCSSAGVAKTLKCPVILVVDGKAISTSAAAIVSGFQQFAPDINIAGVLFNHVNSDHHYQLLKNAVEQYCHIPVLGRLPSLPAVELPSRHLGLMTVQDSELPVSHWDLLADAMEETVDLNALIRLAQMPPSDMNLEPCSSVSLPGEGLTVAVAMDKAFNFYYQANLDLLSASGAQLRYFSPLEDSELPVCDMVYLGGGYPEMHAKMLSDNRSMRASILRAHQNRVAIYAECGGLMYLGMQLTDLEGQMYPMVGILDGESRMTAKLQRFGYCCATAMQDTLLCKTGVTLRGHEFHYSEFTTNLAPVFTLQKRRDGEIVSEWQGGYQVENTLAMYLHVHFAQSPDMLLQWFRRARR